jgi:ribosomal protein S12
MLSPCSAAGLCEHQNCKVMDKNITNSEKTQPTLLNKSSSEAANIATQVKTVYHVNVTPVYTPFQNLKKGTIVQLINGKNFTRYIIYDGILNNNGTQLILLNSHFKRFMSLDEFLKQYTGVAFKINDQTDVCHVVAKIQKIQKQSLDNEITNQRSYQKNGEFLVFMGKFEIFIFILTPKDPLSSCLYLEQVYYHLKMGNEMISRAEMEINKIQNELNDLENYSIFV